MPYFRTVDRNHPLTKNLPGKSARCRFLTGESRPKISIRPTYSLKGKGLKGKGRDEYAER